MHVRKFDSAEKISDEDWHGILNGGTFVSYLLGFEAYQLLVIQNPEIREKMKAHGWGLLCLEAGHFVVFLARKKLILNSILHICRHIQEEVKQLPAEVDASIPKKYAQFTTAK